MVSRPLIPQIVNELLLCLDGTGEVFGFNLEFEVAFWYIRVKVVGIAFENLHHQIIFVDLHCLARCDLRLLLDEVLGEALEELEAPISIAANLVEAVSFEEQLDALVIVSSAKRSFLESFSGTGHVVTLLTALAVHEPGILRPVLHAVRRKALRGLLELLRALEVVGGPLP